MLQCSVVVERLPTLDEFLVRTPSHTFHFKPGNEVATADWVKLVRGQSVIRERSLLKSLFSMEKAPYHSTSITGATDIVDLSRSPVGDPEMDIPYHPQHHCYIYTGKSILGNIWMSQITDESTKVKALKKIKTTTFVIGR